MTGNTPASAARFALDVALALHPRADARMQSQAVSSHTRCILLSALAATSPAYSDALDALIRAEEASDYEDEAAALLEASQIIGDLADDVEAQAEREAALSDRHIDEERAIYRASVL